MPSSPSRQSELRALIAKPFAHRGRHGGSRIENSRAAFEAAIAAGHGIELDVRASRDGQPYVFHDDRLDRLTAWSGRLRKYASAELGSVRLRGCDEAIPTLREALELIAGQVPLLIEIKTSWTGTEALCLAVCRALESYRGTAGVMSYDAGVGSWFGRHAPHRLRGLVIRESGRGVVRKPFFRHWALRRAQPDFLAYRVADLPSRTAAAQRARGLPILAWTCRSAEDRTRAAAHADQIIYEGAAG